MCVLSCSLMSDSLQPPWTAALQTLSVLGGSPGKKLEWAAVPSNPGIEPRSLASQVDSLPSEPPGKPMNTGVCSLSLL